MFKKLRLFATLVGVLAVAAGCQQYDEIEQQPTEAQTLTALAPGSGPGTKITYEDDLEKLMVHINWKVGDRISIFNSNTEEWVANFQATTINENGSATFTFFNGEELVNNTNYTAVYPAVEYTVTSLDQRDADLSYLESTQDGTNNMADLWVNTRMKSGSFQFGGSVGFAHEMSIMTIGVNYPDGIPQKLVYSDNGVDYTVNLTNFEAGGSAVHFMVKPDPTAIKRIVTATISGTGSDVQGRNIGYVPFQAGQRYMWGTSYYGILFDPNGGVDPFASSPAIVRQGGFPGVPMNLGPTDFTYTDKVLAGWSEDPNATTPTYSDEDVYVGTEDVTLYAIWYDLADCVVIDGGKITGVKTDKFNHLTSIIIPSSYNGTPITSVVLGNHYEENSVMRKITISEGISDIPGEWNLAGFMRFIALKEVNLPTSLSTISGYTFKECESLEYLKIPENVTLIAFNAFENSGLKQIDIPASVVSIGVSAFNTCKDLININVDEANTTFSSVDGNLYSADKTELLKVAPAKTSYTFQSNVTHIMSYAFAYTSITEINIPESITYMNSHAFYACPELRKVTLPSTITNIPEFTFYQCKKLENVIVKGSPTGIGEQAFRGCSSLKNFTVPESVTLIGEAAFLESGLTEITIPESVATMGGKIFSRSYNLTKIDVKGKSERPETWDARWNWKSDTEADGFYTVNWNVM